MKVHKWTVKFDGDEKAILIVITKTRDVLSVVKEIQSEHPNGKVLSIGYCGERSVDDMISELN